MKNNKLIIAGVLLVITLSCNIMIFNDDYSQGSEINEKENVYENGIYSFVIPKGWRLTPSDREHYDLGVKKHLMIESGAKSGASFTIASIPLTADETLKTHFDLAYKKGPQIEEVSTSLFERDVLSGLEISYKRPWGEPWWQFHDIWLEKDGEVYVLSFQAYPNAFDTQTQTFDSILDSFIFMNGQTHTSKTPEPEIADFPKPASTARIVFWATGWSVPGSGEEIFVMNVDGSGITNISNSRGDDRDPAWSPDGNQITFTSDRDGNTEVYIMNADGSNQTRVTNSPENEHHPQFSPDGKQIVFSRTIDTVADDLFIIDVDGSGLIRLTNTSRVQENYPHWSPDGKKILFSRFGGSENGGVWIMDRDGKNDRLVKAGAYHYPKWSPDGKYIAFDGQPAGCKFEIYVMRADGSDMRQITEHPAGCGSSNKAPSWSLDGKQLVYASQDRHSKPGTSIFIINVDGTSETALTDLDHTDLYYGGNNPIWSPLP